MGFLLGCALWMWMFTIVKIEDTMKLPCTLNFSAASERRQHVAETSDTLLVVDSYKLCSIHITIF